MSSLLNNDILPLWAWIVIIVIASLVVIGSTTYLIRYIVVLQRKVEFIETFGSDNLPQRHITVRRGRTIPLSKSNSLTGSRFGRSGLSLDVSDARSRARSKGPYDWWMSTIERRRNSQVTESGVSIFSMLSAPLTSGNLYQRPEVQASRISITSKEEKSSTNGTDDDSRRSSFGKPSEVHPTRSFLSNGPFRWRSQILSRISENSPHSSMLSNPSAKSRIQSSTTTVPSELPKSKMPNHIGSLVGELPQPEPTLPQLRPMTTFCVPQLSTVGQQTRTSTLLSPNTTSENSTDTSYSVSSLAYNGSRSSMGLPKFATIPEAENVTHFQDSADDSQIEALPRLPRFWERRTEVRLERKSSRRVLRKKSIRRSLLVSMVNS